MKEKEKISVLWDSNIISIKNKIIKYSICKKIKKYII